MVCMGEKLHNQSRAEQSRAEQSRAEQSRAEQSRAVGHLSFGALPFGNKRRNLLVFLGWKEYLNEPSEPSASSET